MRQLTSLDVQFLAVEDEHTHGHVGSIAIYDPSTTATGELTLADLRRLLRERIHLIPPFTWRLVRVPFDLDHPYWAEDPPAQLAAARAALDQQEADAAALDRDGFIAAFLGRIAAACPPEISATYEQTAPAEQQWAGLDRARRKAAEAGAAGSPAGSGGTGVRKSPDGAVARRR